MFVDLLELHPACKIIKPINPANSIASSARLPRVIFPPNPTPSSAKPEIGNHIAYLGPPVFHKLAGVVTRAVVLITSCRVIGDPLVRLEMDAALEKVHVAPVGRREVAERDMVSGWGSVGATVAVSSTCAP